jgi:hypothetical protein
MVVAADAVVGLVPTPTSERIIGTGHKQSLLATCKKGKASIRASESMNADCTPRHLQSENFASKQPGHSDTTKVYYTPPKAVVARKK